MRLRDRVPVFGRVPAGGRTEVERMLTPPTKPIDLSVFDSKGRVAYVHFDLARAWAQAEGSHDQEAIRALDAADRLAPVRLRNDPIARDLGDRRQRHHAPN